MEALQGFLLCPYLIDGRYGTRDCFNVASWDKECIGACIFWYALIVWKLILVNLMCAVLSDSGRDIRYSIGYV